MRSERAKDRWRCEGRGETFLVVSVIRPLFSGALWPTSVLYGANHIAAPPTEFEEES